MSREEQPEGHLRLAKLEWHVRIAAKLSHKVLNGRDAIQMMKQIEAILDSKA